MIHLDGHGQWKTVTVLMQFCSMSRAECYIADTMVGQSCTALGSVFCAFLGGLHECGQSVGQCTSASQFWWVSRRDGAITLQPSGRLVWDLWYDCQPFLLNGKNMVRIGIYRVKIVSPQCFPWSQLTHTDTQTEHSLTLNLRVNAKLKVKSYSP